MEREKVGHFNQSLAERPVIGSQRPTDPLKTFEARRCSVLLFFFSSHKTHSFKFTPVQVLRHGILEGKLEDRLTSCTFTFVSGSLLHSGNREIVLLDTCLLPPTAVVHVDGTPISLAQCCYGMKCTCHPVCREPRPVSPEP